MAKIAVSFGARDEAKDRLHSRDLASGKGWRVSELLCSAGPADRPFEEQHAQASIAVVLGGTFQYRSSAGHELMTPGSLVLGNQGECFTCGHEHGTGDRCIRFLYSAEFFERVATEAAGNSVRFKAARIPPVRAWAPLVAEVAALPAADDPLLFEEVSLKLAAQAIQMEQGSTPRAVEAVPSSLARVTRVLRMIESEADAPQGLAALAQIARLSPYHFLRAFEAITGTTPHQYLLRLRLRRAALRLRLGDEKVSDIALDSGFGDISNFNRTFRAEFGASPRAYRAAS